MGSRSGTRLARRTPDVALAAAAKQKRQARQKLNLKFTPARNRFSVNPTLTGIGAPANAKQAAVAQFTLPLPRLT